MLHSGPARAPRTTRPKRRGILFRGAVACLALLAVTAYVAVRILTGQEDAHCTVRATGEPEGAGSAADAPGRTPKDAHDYELKPGQAANAATIAAVASRRGLPERAVTIALATAMQESKLSNIGHGDRDSAGLFQQRPSQGWGTMRQIQDPAYSAARFYDHLAKIPGYSRLPLTVAAQRVQRSGFPQAYAKHEANATLLTSALTGRRAAALSCTTSTGNDREPGDPARVRKQLVREFGRDVLADGAGTLTVPARGSRHGWELAHWAVANASGLRIERIAYAGRVWSAGRSRDGWRVAAGDAKAPPEGAQGSGGRGSGGEVELRLAPGH
ncbi:heavy metal transporter [Streptomyces sp. NBC_01186]|uniref:heavy metal transporter n=1 Tax=Streptomyces sp. NBC_01186 TaxID=2903765 RepID=UPI003FA74FCC